MVPEDNDLEGASPRAFGLTFAAVSVTYALWPLWRGHAVRGIFLGIAAVLVAISLLAPRLLAIPSRIWQSIGLALHWVVNPIVMGVLFYLVVTPFGLLVRWRNPEWPARFRPDRAMPTYWVPRTDSGHSMRRQF